MTSSVTRWVGETRYRTVCRKPGEVHSYRMDAKGWVTISETECPAEVLQDRADEIRIRGKVGA